MRQGESDRERETVRQSARERATVRLRERQRSIKHMLERLILEGKEREQTNTNYWNNRER